MQSPSACQLTFLKMLLEKRLILAYKMPVLNCWEVIMALRVNSDFELMSYVGYLLLLGMDLPEHDKLWQGRIFSKFCDGHRWGGRKFHFILFLGGMLFEWKWVFSPFKVVGFLKLRWMKYDCSKLFIIYWRIYDTSWLPVLQLVMQLVYAKKKIETNSQ